MSVLLALVTATGAPVSAQTEAEPITVLAEKLKRVRISPGVTIRNGAVIRGQSKIKRSSGDAELDAVACEAVRICASWAQVNRKSFHTCVQQEGEDGIVSADRRAAATSVRGSNVIYPAASGS